MEQPDIAGEKQIEIDGCTVTLRFREDTNSKALEQIQQTLIQQGVTALDSSLPRKTG